MVSTIKQSTYTEIYEILSYMNEEDVKKIPKEVIYTINTRRQKDSPHKILKDVPLKDQKLDRETIVFLAMLYNKYLRDNKTSEIEMQFKNEQKALTVPKKNLFLNFIKKILGIFKRR